jgi:hypothetical protein
MTPTLDDFINCVNKIYAVALTYDKNDITKANKHTMQWFYAGFYKGLSRFGFTDSPDQAFLDQASQSGVVKLSEFMEPTYTEIISLPHYFATLNGAFIGNTPQPTTSSVILSDCAGWGGDWITFYQSWRSHQSEYPENKGRLYCQSYLGISNAGRTFDLDDWIEDADAFNIASQLHNNSSLRLDDAIKQYYKPTGTTGYWNRFSDFYQGRFNGMAADICLSMLTDISNWRIAGARFWLIQGLNRVGLNYPKVGDLRGFCAGFEDTIQRLLKAEKANLPP